MIRILFIIYFHFVESNSLYKVRTRLKLLQGTVFSLKTTDVLNLLSPNIHNLNYFIFICAFKDVPDNSNYIAFSGRIFSK